MRNKYKGTCYYCGKIVEIGEGHFERYKGGWRTIHANCVFKQRDEKLRRKKMMSLFNVKILFEIKDGEVICDITGNKTVVKAGITTIMDQIAEAEGISTSELLEEFVAVAKMKDNLDTSKLLKSVISKNSTDCDGDCNNCGISHDKSPEPPEHIKAIIEALLGGI